MAPKTIAKTIATTKNAETVTKSFLDQQQSLETLQSMLHGTISTLCYMRGFFCDEAFDEQYYQFSNEFHSYEDLASRDIPFDPQTPRSKSAGLHVLRRNRSKKADEFLDILEKGVYAALQEGNVNAVILNVHPENDRDKVLERYTVPVEGSSPDDRNAQVVAGFEGEAPDSHRTTIASANATLVFLYNILAKFGKGLPKLREEAQEELETERHRTYASIELLYQDGTRKKGHPPLFGPTNGGTMVFAQADGWERRVERVPDIRFGPLTAGLEVNYLQDEEITFEDGVVDRVMPSVVPRNSLRFTRPRSPVKELAKIRSWNAIPANKNSGGSIINIVDTRIEEEEEQSDSAQEPDVEELPGDPHAIDGVSNKGATGEQESSDLPGTDTTGLNESLNTQSSNFFALKKVREMVQPERMTQGDTQWQWFPSQPRSEMDGSAITTNDGSRTQDLDTVRCQCRAEEADVAMVQCQSCNCLQHLGCYGYTGAEDERLPLAHTCYQCLLGENDEARLEELRKLVFKRRGMHLATKKEGLTSQAAFEKVMKPVNVTAARNVYQYLKNKGYVVPVNGERKGGRSQQLRAVRGGTVYEEMMKELFDPFVHISHHFGTPPAKDKHKTAFADQLSAAQSGMMLPPMTPASRMRSAPTTSSRTDLDRRDFVPAIQTPSRPPSFGNNKTKRGWEEGTTAEHASKRHAGPRTLGGDSPSQTDAMLDVSGFSSSPVTAPTYNNA